MLVNGLACQRVERAQIKSDSVLLQSAMGHPGFVLLHHFLRELGEGEVIVASEFAEAAQSVGIGPRGAEAFHLPLSVYLFLHEVEHGYTLRQMLKRLEEHLDGIVLGFRFHLSDDSLPLFHLPDYRRLYQPQLTVSFSIAGERDGGCAMVPFAGTDAVSCRNPSHVALVNDLVTQSTLLFIFR